VTFVFPFGLNVPNLHKAVWVSLLNENKPKVNDEVLMEKSCE